MTHVKHSTRRMSDESVNLLQTASQIIDAKKDHFSSQEYRDLHGALLLKYKEGSIKWPTYFDFDQSMTTQERIDLVCSTCFNALSRIIFLKKELFNSEERLKKQDELVENFKKKHTEVVQILENMMKRKIDNEQETETSKRQKNN